MFAGRWMLAPFYLGLLLAVGLLLIKFIKGFLHFAPLVFTGSDGQIIIALLSLVDVVLVANLVLMIAFASYENFISRMRIEGGSERPPWMGHVSFSNLKMKLIGSVVAISTIELLRVFMDPGMLSAAQIPWKLAGYMALVIAGLLFAIMDRVAEGPAKTETGTDREYP